MAGGETGTCVRLAGGRGEGLMTSDFPDSVACMGQGLIPRGLSKGTAGCMGL